jgi:hypothetical protein
MSKTQTQPKWGTEEDEIVARYEQSVKQGTVKEILLISRD